MIPIPNLSFTGGKGGDATTGDTQAANPLSVGLGGFNVGGVGSTVAGGTSSAGTAGKSWLYLAAGAAAVLVLLGVWHFGRKR